jgi:hypothetical protein
MLFSWLEQPPLSANAKHCKAHLLFAYGLATAKERERERPAWAPNESNRYDE